MKEIWKLHCVKSVIDTSLADLYFFHREPQAEIDEINKEVIIKIMKPLKVESKIRPTKVELKRIEKEMK